MSLTDPVTLSKTSCNTSFTIGWFICYSERMLVELRNDDVRHFPGPQPSSCLFFSLQITLINSCQNRHLCAFTSVLIKRKLLLTGSFHFYILSIKMIIVQSCKVLVGLWNHERRSNYVQDGFSVRSTDGVPVL